MSVNTKIRCIRRTQTGELYLDLNDFLLQLHEDIGLQPSEDIKLYIKDLIDRLVEYRGNVLK